MSKVTTQKWATLDPFVDDNATLAAQIMETFDTAEEALESAEKEARALPGYPVSIVKVTVLATITIPVQPEPVVSFNPNYAKEAA